MNLQLMLGELWSLQGRYRTLHLTWFAFFLTFVVWFNLAPLATTVREDMGLELGQIRTIAICNVALTVPARVIIGMLLDKFGPRLTYSAILVFAAIPCLMFATAQSFGQLVVARLLLSIVGAGFVIGIRMVAEWFPPKEIGLAEGIYGGWGNFGSAFSALTLVIVASWLSFAGGAQIGDVVLNWRGAIALTGIIAAVYGVFYFLSVRDTPPGKTYQRPHKTAGLEVTSMRDFWGLMGMNVPFAGILAVLAWRLKTVGFLNEATYLMALLAILIWYGMQSWGFCARIGNWSPARRSIPRRTATNSNRWPSWNSPISSTSVPSWRWCPCCPASLKPPLTCPKPWPASWPPPMPS